MPIIDGILQAPVSTADVAKCLGVSSLDVGTLCTSKKINMFARYKPYNYPKLLMSLTEEQKKEINYGITVPTFFKSKITAENIIAISKENWGYELPKEGNPYRLSDFAGYYHSAVPPIQLPPYPIEANLAGDGKDILIYIGLDPDDSTYNLQAYDIVGDTLNLKDCRIQGVLLNYKGEVVKNFATEGNLVDSGGDVVNDFMYIKNFTTLYAGTYYLYACLIRANGADFDFYPIPRAGIYNNFPLEVKITFDPSQGGAGIEDNLNNIAFSPGFGLEYFTANYCTDEGDYANKVMYNSTGELLIRVTFNNTSKKDYTLEKNTFALSVNELGISHLPPEKMYSAEPKGGYNDTSSTTSIIVPSEGSVDVWFYWGSVLGEMPVDDSEAAKNTTIEMDLVKNDTVSIWNGALKYYRASVGQGWL